MPVWRKGIRRRLKISREKSHEGSSPPAGTRRPKMKKALTILTALLTFAASAAQIMWVGIDENALVHVDNQILSLNDWMLTFQCAPEDVGARIRIDDVAMPAGYEDPPYQQPPSVVFDDDYSEFGVIVTSYDTGEFVGYANWQPIRLDNTDLSAIVCYDIGYWDENQDWEFITVATATDTLGNLWNQHTYETGTLLPPTETPWKPANYYAIPEPSPSILAILGTLFLLKRRKCQS